MATYRLESDKLFIYKEEEAAYVFCFHAKGRSKKATIKAYEHEQDQIAMFGDEL